MGSLYPSDISRGKFEIIVADLKSCRKRTKSAICSTNSLVLVWLNLKSLHKFVVNHHCLRCYATKPSQCQALG
ncbi:hypothetical protein JSQ73_004155 [Wolbachia endosymbiont of Anopheles demeilloni]|uniref:hypothetical protein n=1 Tax=Wolbachia endosymbiont of Anopheles demeilloni TaxID=2748871 RepID=UPI001F31B3E6|nr:hypothetical protein [Wolbachia endosymbiont of Anopheles demeilloni]UIP92370.1 hypothetical protein JSQ73_004155 [Wolbachia endosymbiont of Anopheles demeilloni]